MKSIKFIFLLCLLPALTSCSVWRLESAVLYNLSDKEIMIETSPNLLHGNGLATKYIGLEDDSTNRGAVWKFGMIDCIIVGANNPQEMRMDTARYILMPESGHDLSKYVNVSERPMTAEDLKIHRLIIMTSTDTMRLNSKEEIWAALNFDIDNNNDWKELRKRKMTHLRHNLEKGLVIYQP